MELVVMRLPGVDEDDQPVGREPTGNRRPDCEPAARAGDDRDPLRQ
jgi:hypothetical protein